MRPFVLLLCAIAGTVVFGLVVAVPESSTFSTAVSDLGQLTAATLGALACARGAQRSPRELRAAWAWIAAGAGMWAAGQAVWTYYEVVEGQAVPFPSLADAGFLAFPVLAARGMMLWLATQESVYAKGRYLLDGLLVAGSLLALSWVTALGSVVSSGPDVDWVAFLLSVSYPVGDVAVGTLAPMALARWRHEEQTTLVLLALGLLSVSCADSAFVFLTNTEQFSSSDVLANSGWFLGFWVIGLAGSGLALHHQTLHDALTGLPNRVLFAQRLDHALEHSCGQLTVLFCDLDDFKPINDRHGHETGDLVLREAASRMTSAVRVSDTVARMGGDEFAVLLPDNDDSSRAAERILEALAEDLLVDGHRIAASMSIGCAQLTAATGLLTPTPEDRVRQAAELLRTADLDMYYVKAARRRAEEDDLTAHTSASPGAAAPASPSSLQTQAAPQPG